MPDQLVGTLSRKCNGKEAYIHLIGSHDRPPWAKHIWASFIPHFRSTIIWRALQNRLPIKDKLITIGFQLVSMCSFYKAANESLCHILLHFHYA